MAVNKYFQRGVPESFAATQKLTEDLIIQSMQINGMEMYYIPRTMIKIDTVLNEATVSEFKDAIKIEMYLENVQGFEGDGGFLSKFGIEINDSCTLIVARRRWTDEVGRQKKAALDRPCEGDIIFFPLTKSFFEIKKVIADNPFFQLGKLYVYKLECELFRHSSEEFNTGVSEIDDLINPKTLMDELGLGDPDEDSVVADVPGAQNVVFEEEGKTVLNFDESNPFGDA